MSRVHGPYERLCEGEKDRISKFLSLLYSSIEGIYWNDSFPPGADK